MEVCFESFDQLLTSVPEGGWGVGGVSKTCFSRVETSRFSLGASLPVAHQGENSGSGESREEEMARTRGGILDGGKKAAEQ